MDEPRARQYSLFIDNGVLYCEFKDESCLENILAAEQEALQLLYDKNIDLIPVVITMRDVDQSKTDLNIANLSKVLTSNKLVDYVSGIWVVGAEKNIKTIVNFINGAFFDGRIHFVDTLEEAKKDAIVCKNTKSPILEQL